MADPPIRVIPTSFQQVLDLLTSEHLRAVERAIAAEVGMRVVEDFSAAATSYTQAEVSVSGMTTSDVEALLRDRRDRLVAFGARLLRDQAATRDEEEYPEGEEQDPSGPPEPVGLGAGFGVKYAIYYNFLASRTAAELRAFLKNRRIPHHARFSQDLRRLFDEVR